MTLREEIKIKSLENLEEEKIENPTAMCFMYIISDYMVEKKSTFLSSLLTKRSNVNPMPQHADGGYYIPTHMRLPECIASLCCIE